MNFNILRVGLLLGWKQIKHSSIWTNILIIFVMMLTFLNLVVVSGILVGLIEGSVRALNQQYSGDILISTYAGDEYIEDSNRIISTLDTLSGIDIYSARAGESVTAEANYRERRDPNELPDTVGASLTGIDVSIEDQVTGLSKYVVDGEYLSPDDTSGILIGSFLLKQYVSKYSETFPSLDNIKAGSRVLLKVGDRQKEYIVRGIIDSKVDEMSSRIFMTKNEFRRLTGRNNLNVNEIAIRVKDGFNPADIKKAMIDSGFAQDAEVRLSEEAVPPALDDIIITFNLLGNGISSIGLAVSSITIFIVIFINAITRRKYIGIMKGIGIKSSVIELSYVFQSLVYAVIGSTLGLIIIYVFLVPFFNAHPINFPFSDGILVAPPLGTFIRLMVLIIATIIAGYIPAWLITKKNTLDSILGR